MTSCGQVDQSPHRTKGWLIASVGKHLFSDTLGQADDEVSSGPAFRARQTVSEC